MSDYDDATWERVERLRDLVAGADDDLARAIDARSPVRLSTAAQTVVNSGIELMRLLGRVEATREEE